MQKAQLTAKLEAVGAALNLRVEVARKQPSRDAWCIYFHNPGPTSYNHPVLAEHRAHNGRAGQLTTQLRSMFATVENKGGVAWSYAKYIIG